MRYFYCLNINKRRGPVDCRSRELDSTGFNSFFTNLCFHLCASLVKTRDLVGRQTPAVSLNEISWARSFVRRSLKQDTETVEM